MKRWWMTWILAAGWLLPANLLGQGLLVDTHPGRVIPLPRPVPQPSPPPASYRIKALSVQARLSDQVAVVEVSQSFVNTGSRQMEVCFVFPLPYDGAVDRLTLMVDGKEYPAQLMAADEARRIYQEIVRKNQDPALLEWLGSGMFKTSVFPVPAGAERTVSLRYSQLLRREHGLTDFLFPLSTAKYTSQPVEKLEFRLAIEASAPLKNVYSPTHDVKIERPDDRRAVVTMTAANQVPQSDFRLMYDVGDQPLSAKVLSYRPQENEPGYFLLLATPQTAGAMTAAPEKTVVLVVDRSGSMQGKKIEQAREALKFVLRQLRPGDRFNILSYASEVEAFRPELQKVDDSSRAAALAFADGLFAGGSTNIDGALSRALAMLEGVEPPCYVLFLTDGLPTVGERNEAKIVENARSRNTGKARVITFGVGYDVNSRLLDKLARANYGQSQYVRENEDLEEHVSRLYAKISDPILTDVQVHFAWEGQPAGQAAPVNRMYPAAVHDLFAGEPLVLVGRYHQPGNAEITVSGNLAGQPQSFKFPAAFVATSGDESVAFVERLWAVRRIGEIIDELDLHGQNEELVKELVALSTRHGVLTPYTAFLADETASTREVASNVRRAAENLDRLAQTEGKAGFAQRAYKNQLQQAANAAQAGVSGGGGQAVVVDADKDHAVAVQTVKQVGNRAFYRRCDDQRWVDSTVTEEMEREAKRVVQFSDEYFRLADRHGRTLAQYLVWDEPALVNLGGTAYFIDPPKAN